MAAQSRILACKAPRTEGPAGPQHSPRLSPAKLRGQRGLLNHSTVPDSRLESSADRGACRTTAQSQTLSCKAPRTEGPAGPQHSPGLSPAKLCGQRGLQDHSTVLDSCLESSTDRGACRTTACGASECQTLLMHAHTDFHNTPPVYVGPLLLYWMT